MVELTHQQLDAVNTREVSVALAAGAGCGKTHVLTERFLSHLDRERRGRGGGGSDVARLSQLIAITFTDAAAREMRFRIRKACYDRINDPAMDEAAQADWLRLLREIDTARVSTIHAFCTALLRTHAAEAGLDPTFGVMEQGETDVLLSQTIDDVLRERLAALDDEALDLATAFGLADLKERLALLVNQRHLPAFTSWHVPTEEALAAKSREMLRIWQERLGSDAFSICVQTLADELPIAQMQHLLRRARPISGNKKFATVIGRLEELLTRVMAGTIRPDELNEFCQLARVQSTCKKDDFADPRDFDHYKDCCEKVRGILKRRQLPEWDPAVAEEAALLGLKLLRLSHQVTELFQRRKQAQGKLDFTDQLVLAYGLLSDASNAILRERLCSDLQLLLVDEFQDTDPLQVRLIRTLCGDGLQTGRLFFVGDLKQSIYRFRGAAPAEFRDLRESIPEAGRLPLTHNFRSQPGVLHFINALFCDAFEEYDPLEPERSAATGAPAVEFLWTIADEKEKRSKGDSEEARRKEAAAIARRLRELFAPDCPLMPVVDKETNRPRRARPGDVAILLQALSDVALYEEALRDQGLEYYLVGGHAFYSQQEIYDVLNLLRAVASAADEVSLAGVLRSPFFALLDETLFWLVDSARSLNAGLLSERLPTQLSDEERSKVKLAAETIRHLRANKDRMPIAALLNEALDRTGYDAVLLSEFLGERKLANLQKLIEQARAADHGGAMDLDGFIAQLAEFIARPPKEAPASTSPETADVIRIMTIHRAKGLEFPLVVAPDLDRPPRDRPPAAVLDDALGPLLRMPNDDERPKTATGMTLFAARHRLEERKERARLLYVVTTRAADYLILSSSLAAYDEPKSDWMKLLGSRFDLETGRLLVNLPPKYETPEICLSPVESVEVKTANQSRGLDLLRILDQSHELAKRSGGLAPADVAPVPADCSARRQFAVSRLSGKLVEASGWLATSDPTIASNYGAAALDRRILGSLVHEALARIDLRNPCDIAEWCELLASRHLLSDAKEAAKEAVELIQRFITSDLCRQLSEAAPLEREVEFLLAWPPGTANGDTSYFRGFIDCLYCDAQGEWHIADYKTENVSRDETSQAAQRYKMQLYVYALAAERVLGTRPVELVVHFLRTGEQYIFPWNDISRRNAMELINHAIAEPPPENGRRQIREAAKPIRA